jgi:signal transduction histidine kinase
LSPTIDELRATNGRLLGVADGERRRIERALHDGVQQDLIAVSIRVQLARQLVGADLPAVIAVLDEITGDVRDALDRVRVLANEIYPSLLDVWGLPDALRGAASAAGIAATVEATGVGRYPKDVETAVYFVCRDALAAIVEHAGAGARVTIRIHEEEHALLLEVDSDAAGQWAAADLLGFARDRVGARGGIVTVDSAPDRVTRFAATVPLA